MEETDVQLEAARQSFARREWQAAFDGFTAAEAQGTSLTGADHDALAESGHWVGRADIAIRHYEAAHDSHLAAGEPCRAALSGFNLAIYLRLRGESARADGWMSRTDRLLSDQPEGAEHGYPLFLRTAAFLGSDLDAALVGARRMQDIGRRFGDDTLVALGLVFEGRALVKRAEVGEGRALLDEAMLAALTDRLKPMWTGAVYCGLLDACHELVDLPRAREWTEATRRWVTPLPPASLYPGICRVHWAGILHTRGAWEQAEAEALAACADMAEIDQFVVADGWYEVGEIRRRRGDLVGAGEAYQRAHASGRDPQPGFALLRLAEGRTDAACSSIRAALAGFSGGPLDRAPLQAAEVEIALAGGELERAEQAAVELSDTAARFDSDGLAAMALVANGRVALARAEAVTALAALRRAVVLWESLESPFDAARARILLADALAAMDDDDGATRERDVARACFEQLGAIAGLRELGVAPEGAIAAAPAGLSPREVEVLQLIATGLTNRAVAEQLYLSEKTVARHVANIFTKIGVSTRSAATAYAFSHGLVTEAAT